MREKGQTEVAKTLETPVFSRGIEILTEKFKLKFICFKIGNTYQIPKSALIEFVSQNCGSSGEGGEEK